MPYPAHHHRNLLSGAGRFVFVDECSTNTSLSPIYRLARRGHRVYYEAPRDWGKNVTLLSSMSRSGMGPSMAVEGAPPPARCLKTT